MNMDPNGRNGRLSLFSFINAGAPLPVRVWNRAMMIMVYVVIALSVPTFFGLIPATLSWLPSFTAIATLTLFVVGWGYTVRRMPERGPRHTLGLSRRRNIVVNSAAVVTVAGVVALNITLNFTDEPNAMRVGAFIALIGLIVGITAVLTRPKPEKASE